MPSSARSWNTRTRSVAFDALWAVSPIFDELADSVAVSRLAADADPWITLAAISTATDRIRLGSMVTPLARRRPATLREQAGEDAAEPYDVVVALPPGNDPTPKPKPAPPGGSLRFRGIRCRSTRCVGRSMPARCGHSFRFSDWRHTRRLIPWQANFESGSSGTAWPVGHSMGN
jgi:hypothetical protein